MNIIRDRYRVLSEEEFPLLLSREPTRFTSNPLRLGEPARVFGSQSHIWGKQPNKSDAGYKNFIRSKEMQNIAICMEDVNHLIAFIKIIPQASDYTNKLLGKYIILEINNISSCFQNLSQVSEDFRKVNSSLQKRLKNLDKKYRFKDVRNKMTAHKHHKGSTLNLSMSEQIELWHAICSESLNAYLQMVHQHIAMLKPLAPFEQQQMFQANDAEMPGVLPPLCAEDYTPFYEETKAWRPKHPTEEAQDKG